MRQHADIITTRETIGSLLPSASMAQPSARKVDELPDDIPTSLPHLYPQLLRTQAKLQAPSYCGGLLIPAQRHRLQPCLLSVDETLCTQHTNIPRVCAILTMEVAPGVVIPNSLNVETLKPRLKRSLSLPLSIEFFIIAAGSSAWQVVAPEAHAKMLEGVAQILKAFTARLTRWKKTKLTLGLHSFGEGWNTGLEFEMRILETYTR
ncbi:hypothetical protein BKA70DRAFT_103111 [Coprinopsis sp. MPI-PUGE-AT-0042]|nr:hypothetical protein BKA70DRAFT_103111 [Coprinopsis sp. MPI-PUGE-AT-0042]